MSCVSSSAAAHSKEDTPITEKIAINKRMRLRDSVRFVTETLDFSVDAVDF